MISVHDLKCRIETCEEASDLVHILPNGDIIISCRYHIPFGVSRSEVLDFKDPEIVKLVELYIAQRVHES